MRDRHGDIAAQQAHMSIAQRLGLVDFQEGAQRGSGDRRFLAFSGMLDADDRRIGNSARATPFVQGTGRAVMTCKQSGECVQVADRSG